MGEKIMPAALIEGSKSEDAERGRQFNFTVRGHHIPRYEDLLLSIGNHRYFGNPYSLDDICEKLALRNLEEIKKPHPDDAINFRTLYGYSESDNTIPATYIEDVVGYVGDDPGSHDNERVYVQKTKQTYLNFLTLPAETPALVGTLIDEVCRNCFFGDGKGGAHCPLVGVKGTNGTADDYQDERETNSLQSNLQYFLTIPELRRRQRIHPERYQYQAATAQLESPLVNVSPDSSDSRTVIQLPLGLLRDVLTHTVAQKYELDKSFGGPIYSFQQLLSCRRPDMRGARRTI